MAADLASVADQLWRNQVVKICDLHISIYSSFILESLSLGIPNIILDYNSIGTDYLVDILDDAYNVHFCKSNNQISDIIRTWPFNENDEIKKHYNYLFDNQSNNKIILKTPIN